MKKLIQNPRFHLLCSIIAAIPAALLQALAYLQVYGDSGSNYFSSASPLPDLAVIFALLSCAFGVAAVCLWKKAPIHPRTPSGSLTSIPAALGFWAGAVLMLLSNDTKLTYAVAIFFFLAAAYQLLLAFQTIKDSFLTAFIGFSAVIGCILLEGYYYFDATLEMNAPVKVSVLIGLLFAMIYYTNELRWLIGNPFPRANLLISACLLGIGALSAIPVPLAFLLGKFDRLASVKTDRFMVAQFLHPEYLAGAVVLLGVCITVGWRLCQLLKDNASTAHQIADESGKEEA